MKSVTCNKAFNGLYFDILDIYMRFISSERFSLEKNGKIWKYRLFLGWICPDWGNSAGGDMAGLGSIGLEFISKYIVFWSYFSEYNKAHTFQKNLTHRENKM